MSLKVYNITQGEVQDYIKEGTPDLLSGIQFGMYTKLLPIYNGNSAASAITEVTAVKLNASGSELSRTSLATDLIIHDAGTSQYLIDEDKRLSLDECIYLIEFKDANFTFQSEPFLVQNNTDFTSEYQLIYDNFTIKPSSSVAAAQDRMVLSLVDSGIWAKLDLFAYFSIYLSVGLFFAIISVSMGLLLFFSLAAFDVFLKFTLVMFGSMILTFLVLGLPSRILYRYQTKIDAIL